MHVLWPEATRRLREDPAFGPVVERVGPVVDKRLELSHFQMLARAIVYQQLAGKAAATIHGRFTDALGGDVTPASVLAAPDDTLRSAGLSRGKLAAIRDLADKVSRGEVPLDHLDELDDEPVVQRLLPVRGIGLWTAEMFLIFQLHRPDVWPVDDLGVRVGMGKLLGMTAAPSPKELTLIGTGYRPWRSAAAWYCWRAVELPTIGTPG